MASNLGGQLQQAPMLPPMVPSSWLPLPGGIPDVKNYEHLSRVHPLTLQYMEPDHQTFKGKVNLGNILHGANIEMKDLPTLEGSTDNNGKSTLCLNWCLGIYSYANKGKCQITRGHLANDKIIQNFESNLCQVITPGVQYVLTHRSVGQGPPQRKQKELGDPWPLGMLGNVKYIWRSSIKLEKHCTYLLWPNGNIKVSANNWEECQRRWGR